MLRPKDEPEPCVGAITQSVVKFRDFPHFIEIKASDRRRRNKVKLPEKIFPSNRIMKCDWRTTFHEFAIRMISVRQDLAFHTVFQA